MITQNKPSMLSAWVNQSSEQFISGSNLAELVDSPVELVASENMQAFTFVPVESGVEAFAQLILLVSSGTTAGFVLDITGNAVNVVLTASATPTFNQFYTDGTNTAAAKSAVARAIVTELNDNLAFSNYYDCYAEDAKIVITAKVAGPLYNLTVNTLPASFTQLVNTVGVAKYAYQGVIDYSTYVEVYEGEGEEYGNTLDRLNFSLIANIDIPFSSTESNINVNGATKNYVDVELPLKRQNVGIDATLLDERAYNAGRMPILRPYFISYYDSIRYSANAEKKKSLIGVSKVIWTQNAAQHKLNAYFLEDYVWDANTTKAFKWLTDRPNATPVTYDSHQYLQVIYKYNAKATGTFWIELKVNFYDGTDQTSLFGGASGFPYSSLNNNISFDISPNALGLENIESVAGKLIDTYEVSLKWTRTPTSPVYYSETKTFKFLRRCGDQSNNVIWFNKFGGWDSLEFLGTLSTSIQRNVSEITRVLPFNANGRAGSLSTAASEEVRLTHKINSNSTFSLTSNLLPNGHYQWVQGILESPAVFIWDKNQKQYVAIVISDYEYSYDTELDEFAIRISYSYTVDNNTITR